MIEEWRKPEHRGRLGTKVLYATCDKHCYKLTIDNWDEDNTMMCTQEEADTMPQ